MRDGYSRSGEWHQQRPVLEELPFFCHWSTAAGREQSEIRQERPADAGTGEPCGKKEMPLDLAQKQLPQEPKTGLGAWENPETSTGVRRRDCWAVVCW